MGRDSGAACLRGATAALEELASRLRSILDHIIKHGRQYSERAFFISSSTQLASHLRSVEFKQLLDKRLQSVRPSCPPPLDYSSWSMSIRLTWAGGIRSATCSKDLSSEGGRRHRTMCIPVLPRVDRQDGAQRPRDPPLRGPRCPRGATRDLYPGQSQLSRATHGV